MPETSPKNCITPRGVREDSNQGESWGGASFLKICLLDIFGNISSNLSLDRCQKHPKKIVDSGSWSIYNGKKLYPDIHILATALCNRHSKLFQSCQITVAHTKCLVHTCQKNCHKLYFRAQIK